MPKVYYYLERGYLCAPALDMSSWPGVIMKKWFSLDEIDDEARTNRSARAVVLHKYPLYPT